jgi:hypothetical protein
MSEQLFVHKTYQTMGALLEYLDRAQPFSPLATTESTHAINAD